MIRNSGVYVNTAVVVEPTVEIIHVLRLRVGAEIRVVDVRAAGRSHVAQSAPRWRRREEVRRRWANSPSTRSAFL